MHLIRELHRGMRGPDVRAMKRALRKAGTARGLVMSSNFGKQAASDLRSFQRRHGLVADGVLGKMTFQKLAPYVDRYGRWLFSKAPHQTEQELMFARMVAAMHYMAEHTPGYVLGGGHGIPVEDINPNAGTDCSSSCAWVLWKGGFLPGKTITPLSWEFLDWGLPGSGNFFSLEVSPSHADGIAHVWIRLYKTHFWRFDTSPHGDGGKGPKLRMLPRFTFGFIPRHWKGL